MRTGFAQAAAAIFLLGAGCAASSGAAKRQASEETLRRHAYAGLRWAADEVEAERARRYARLFVVHKHNMNSPVVREAALAVEAGRKFPHTDAEMEQVERRLDEVRLPTKLEWLNGTLGLKLTWSQMLDRGISVSNWHAHPQLQLSPGYIIEISFPTLVANGAKPEDGLIIDAVTLYRLE